ncbi:hypothetical protein JCM9140_821 [Halalkalibacter wakoensis JCM 9140]|uniref:Uncharacterized protein n=1 Tax=Halalkalibacter wakoensis JCM 9140 TaxID=1236970 RepID=W4PYF2_9BACI|nr:hypothetical protein [Halalkalibacter wakoensis]GAE24861.1 hypothetical protein JCM9140_821 [Halalkalibacter wakoensis JCM 9140]
MPRKTADANVEKDLGSSEKEEEIHKLSEWLAAVLHYLADDEVEEIDIEYLLSNTEGLRNWWDQYRENNRKNIEEEIKQSLANLTLEQLESIHETVKAKQ